MQVTYRHLLALLLLVVVAALGLAEGARARALRTEAQPALTAAVQSAARAPVPEQQAAFMRILKANLPGRADYRAELAGGPTALTGRLFLPFHIRYLSRWLPPFTLEISHTEPVLKRKPRA
ncbi:MAG TPA: hypothetical protein VD969_10675 [Symbiobacteriaceae bacterium]|nr:hypothetical protein [Symbiobacteriaceae bacterium]